MKVALATESTTISKTSKKFLSSKYFLDEMLPPMLSVLCVSLHRNILITDENLKIWQFVGAFQFYILTSPSDFFFRKRFVTFLQRSVQLESLGFCFFRKAS